MSARPWRKRRPMTPRRIRKNSMVIDLPGNIKIRIRRKVSWRRTMATISRRSYLLGKAYAGVAVSAKQAEDAFVQLTQFMYGRPIPPKPFYDPPIA